MDPQKILCFRANTDYEAREHISKLPAQSYNEGDKVEVTYPDGTKHVYIFRSAWFEEGGIHIIKPDN